MGAYMGITLFILSILLEGGGLRVMMHCALIILEYFQELMKSKPINKNMFSIFCNYCLPLIELRLRSNVFYVGTDTSATSNMCNLYDMNGKFTETEDGGVYICSL